MQSLTLYKDPAAAALVLLLCQLPPGTLSALINVTVQLVHASEQTACNFTVPWEECRIPSQSLFLACARAAGISRSRCDTEHVTPLCGVAAGGRLPSCPPFQSRRVREEEKPFTVTSSPQSREHMFEDICSYFGAQGQMMYTMMPPKTSGQCHES